MKINIIFEDNHLLVVEKPVNMPVQEDSSQDMDLLTWLKADLKERYNKPGNVYLGLVHRLDRPVGGVMVYAKTSKAASRLANSLRKNEFHRTYLAIVQGIVEKSQATLTDYLWKDRQKNQVYVVGASKPDAKKAILHYKQLEYSESMTLLNVELETGRSHQIRVQLQNMGHPLFGDQKYGDHRTIPHTQIALWANTLSFPHPTKKDLLHFQSMPPLTQEPWQSFTFNQV